LGRTEGGSKAGKEQFTANVDVGWPGVRVSPCHEPVAPAVASRGAQDHQSKGLKLLAHPDPRRDPSRERLRVAFSQHRCDIRAGNIGKAWN